jgi:hypothetical protein
VVEDAHVELRDGIACLVMAGVVEVEGDEALVPLFSVRVVLDAPVVAADRAVVGGSDSITVSLATGPALAQGKKGDGLGPSRSRVPCPIRV